MNPSEAELKAIVEQAGGKWVGIQSREFLGKEPLVLFNDPQGSTLSLPLSMVTPENVKARLEGKIFSEQDNAVAYLSIEGVGYALTEPLDSKYPEPKPFLIRMSPATLEKHKAELKPTKVSCIATKTGARFCIIRYNDQELEAMEMANPIWELSIMAKEHRVPTIEEARKAGKNDFLVIEQTTVPEEIHLEGHIS